ncbi:4-diphosphocytidyl-2-c-methyl-d-erythritol kinase [hydrocarbon metagenome]|uniref:4-(cytidine 5'-diphospho)-2-C-methyl-D-erythritol kinase n=1 Tax=hydrocarbon metagenome TaxID=938273 RepID=A0A0W8E9F2_9ZZZZ
MNRNIIIEAPAKINLTLDVKGKRSDGYHELETVMHQIDLVDRIHIQPDTSISVKSNSPDLPNDSSNLAYKAAQLILQTYGSGEGAAIFIEKNIPIGAGLAGGSTDAAAVLRGINVLYNYNIPNANLIDISARIGSDVPFCLQGNPRIIMDENDLRKDEKVKGSTCVARGRGELLTSLNARFLPWILIVKPDFQLSTAEVYENFKMDQVYKVPDLDAFIKAWARYDIIEIAHCCENVLETISTVLCPEVLAIKKQLEKMRAIKATMSGSGPAVFGVFENHEDALKAQQIMRHSYCETYLVSSYGRGD